MLCFSCVLRLLYLLVAVMMYVGNEGVFEDYNWLLFMVEGFYFCCCGFCGRLVHYSAVVVVAFGCAWNIDVEFTHAVFGL